MANMIEIEEIKAQMATMLTTMQHQQEVHEQEIKKLKNQSGKYGEINLGPGTSTNIRIKQPDTYDGHKGSIDLWIFQMQQYLLATGIKDEEQVVYLATNLLRGDAATW